MSRHQIEARRQAEETLQAKGDDAVARTETLKQNNDRIV